MLTVGLEALDFSRRDCALDVALLVNATQEENKGRVDKIHKDVPSIFVALQIYWHEEEVIRTSQSPRVDQLPNGILCMPWANARCNDRSNCFTTCHLLEATCKACLRACNVALLLLPIRSSLFLHLLLRFGVFIVGSRLGLLLLLQRKGHEFRSASAHLALHSWQRVVALCLLDFDVTLCPVRNHLGPSFRGPFIVAAGSSAVASCAVAPWSTSAAASCWRHGISL